MKNRRLAAGIVLVGFTDNVLTARSIAARHGYRIDPNQELFALGVTNLAAGISPVPLSHAEVIEAGQAAGPRISRLLADIVAKVASNETLSISDTAAVLDINALVAERSADPDGAPAPPSERPPLLMKPAGEDDWRPLPLALPG